jgi:FAD/FMN-containing dehydrogenase
MAVSLRSLPSAFRGSVFEDEASLRLFSSSRGPVYREPLAVVRPADVESVAVLAQWASMHGVALIARGAGTGMPGGNTGPGVIVDLTGLTLPLTLEAEGHQLRAGAGVIARDADAEARRHGRWLPALPSSAEWCTLGGMVANDAAGARSFRFGPVHEWLREVTWVRSDGSIEVLHRGDAATQPAWIANVMQILASNGITDRARWPDVRKNSSGYALHRAAQSGHAVDLVPASEGTLGLIVEVVVATHPQPQTTGVALVGLPTLDALPRVAEIASEAGASACEYFGRRLLELGELDGDPRLAALDCRQGAALIEFAGSADEVAAGLSTVTAAAVDLGGSLHSVDTAEVEALWHLRHAASPTIARAAAQGRRSLQFIEDSVVPVPRVGQYAQTVSEILARHDTDGVIFGHLGDGHLHVNPLIDLVHEAWPSRVRDILDEVVQLVGDLGGTLAGEHGDGRLRAPLLERIWSPAHMAAFRSVKDLFDPQGVLNPGVIMPLAGQDPLEGFAQGPELRS